MCGTRFQSNGPQFRRCGECTRQVKTWKTVGEDTALEEFYLMESNESGYSNTRNVCEEEYYAGIENIY